MNTPRAYYNDNDPDAVAVLRELIASDVIAPGDVDHRSIKEVSPDDIKRYTQCHFFAGAGLWSVAARLAGWPDERELWTGSCPCQPFSAAGKRTGTDDPRHLWPDFYRLIRARRPSVVMGEQVAGKAGYDWFDGVRADLEREKIVSRTVDIPACAVDAPHQRNRLYWLAVADADCAGLRNEPRRLDGARRAGQSLAVNARAGALANANVSQFQREPSTGQQPLVEQNARTGARHPDGPHSALGDTGSARLRAPQREALFGTERREEGRATSEPNGALGARARACRYKPIATNPTRRNGSWWADAEWIECHDGKARRTKPGLPLLVNGLLGRVAVWRLAGNAISPILAAEVIGAFLDAEESPT